MLIKKSSIHIAHGLNPSNKPKIIATNGIDTFLRFTFPKSGNFNVSLE